MSTEPTREKSLFSTSQDFDKALRQKTMQQHSQHRNRTKQRVSILKPLSSRRPASPPPPASISIIKHQEDDDEDEDEEKPSDELSSLNQSRQIGGNPAPWRARSHFEREMKQLALQETDDDSTLIGDSDQPSRAATSTREHVLRRMVRVSVPIAVLFVASIIALLSVVSLLYPSMNRSFQMFVQEKTKMTSSDVKASSWSALTAAYAGQSGISSGTISCAADISAIRSRQRIVDVDYADEIDLNLYFLNSSHPREDWCSVVRNSTGSGGGTSSASSSTTVGKNTVDIHRLLAMVNETMRSNDPWFWNVSVVSSSTSFRLFHVLPAGAQNSHFHVIASIEMTKRLETNFKRSAADAQATTGLVTGDVAVEVEIMDVAATSTMASASAGGGTESDLLLVQAAIQCCRDETKMCGTDVKLATSTFTSSCTNLTAERGGGGSSAGLSSTGSFSSTPVHPNVVVGSSAERTYFFQAQGTIEADESTSAVALVSFVCVFVTLTMAVSTTTTHLEQVVSDVAKLQASTLRQQVEFEMNKFTSMLSVLSQLESGIESTLENEAIKEKTLLDIAAVVRMDTSSAGLVYYGDETTGNFYGVTTVSDIPEFILRNANTSFTTASYPITKTKKLVNGVWRVVTSVNYQKKLSQDDATYDPRIRPWYILAMEHYKSGNRTAIWSPVYKFFGGANLDDGLGITVAQALPNATGVIAMDITLEKISELLRSKLLSLGKFNSTTSLWVSEETVLGKVIGSGRGQATVNMQRLTASEIKPLDLATKAVERLKLEKHEKEMHVPYGTGIDHQEITTLRITSGKASGLEWWLVQSMQFKDFTREVQVEGSAALLIGVVLSVVAAITTRLGHFCFDISHKTTDRQRLQQKQAVQVATDMRLEALRVTKPMSPLLLNELIREVLQRSLRKYSRTREFWFFEFSEDHYIRPNLKWIHKNLLGGDTLWNWIVFFFSLIHLMLSFWDAPKQPLQYFTLICIVQGVCIFIELLDVSLRIGLLCAVEKTRGCCGKCPAWSGELSPPSLRMSSASLRLIGSLRVIALGLLLVDYCYRSVSYYGGLQQLQQQQPNNDNGFVVYSAPLRAVVIVLAHDSFVEALSAFLSTVWRAKQIFNLGLQFLIVVNTLLISCLQNSYNPTNEIGRGLRSFEGSFLTNFIFIFTSANYADLVYGHAEFGTSGEVAYSLFFLLVILIGMFLFLSILLSVFQTQFTDTFTAAEEERKREREEGYSIVFIGLCRKQAKTRTSILSRGLSEQEDRLSGLLRRQQSSIDVDRVKSEVSLEVAKTLVMNAFTNLPGSNRRSAERALDGVTSKYLSNEEFLIGAEKLRLELGSFKTNGIGRCRHWSLCCCDGGVDGALRKVAPNSIRNIFGRGSEAANKEANKSSKTPASTVEIGFFGSALYSNLRIVLVFSNAWVVCFLATPNGSDVHLHLIVTSSFLFLHHLDVISHIYTAGFQHHMGFRLNHKPTFKELANRADLIVIIISLFIFLIWYIPMYVRTTTAQSVSTISNITTPVVDINLLLQRSSTPEKFALGLPSLRIFTTVKTTQQLSFGLLSLMGKQQIADLFTLLMLFLYIFGVIGCNLFSNKLTLLSAAGSVHPAANFDTFGQTLRTMFQLLLGDFTDVLYAAIDAYGSLWPSVYFISFAVLMALVFTNLVVGVVCDLYLSEVYVPMLSQANLSASRGVEAEEVASLGVEAKTSDAVTVENPAVVDRTNRVKMADVLRDNAELKLENMRLIAALKMSTMKRALPHILRKRMTRARRSKERRDTQRSMQSGSEKEKDFL